MSTAATAYNSVARGAVTTGGIWGNTAARYNDDIFGNGTVFVPPSELLFPSRPLLGPGCRQAGTGRVDCCVCAAGQCMCPLCAFHHSVYVCLTAWFVFTHLVARLRCRPLQADWGCGVWHSPRQVLQQHLACSLHKHHECRHISHPGCHCRWAYKRQKLHSLLVLSACKLRAWQAAPHPHSDMSLFTREVVTRLPWGARHQHLLSACCGGAVLQVVLLTACSTPRARSLSTCAAKTLLGE